MSEPHRIRLRGPWETNGTKRVRKFGRPRLTNAAECVWLVIESGNGAVWLNGQLLGNFTNKFRWHVTERLNDRNQIEIESAGELGEVLLEISGE